MVYAIILAGGKGERFWPLSRTSRPKQFLPIAGDRTLLSETAERLHPLIPDKNHIVVAGRDHVALVRESLPYLGPGHLIEEPRGRNTAPAVALGAALALDDDPEATIVVVPSDAWVGDDGAYRTVLSTAIRAAETEAALVTIGVTPSRPETGYGYLEVGDALPGENGVFRVRRFVEKPDGARAVEYLSGGRHLWNCGIFVMRARVLIDELKTHLPEVHGPLEEWQAATNKPEATERFYAAVPSISIDYGLMEKSEQVLTVRASFPWDDLGSWAALERVMPVEGDHRSRGDTVILDSPGAIIHAESGIVAVIGLPDVVVVRTKDATLVVPKERAQEVRRVIEALSQDDDLKRYL